MAQPTEHIGQAWGERTQCERRQGRTDLGRTETRANGVKGEPVLGRTNSDKSRGEKNKAEPVSKMIISRPTNLNRKRNPVIASYIDTRKTDINIDDIEKLKILKQSPGHIISGLGIMKQFLT